MFKIPSGSQWKQEDLHKQISFVQGSVLMKEMQEDTDLQGASALKVDQEYPIYKSVGGVKIESGSILLRPALLKETLSLLDSFLPSKKEPFEAHQNFEALCLWAESFGWPKPDSSKCEGYILNCEMVRFSSDEKGSFFIFKYKDGLSDIFMLYRLWFLLAGRSYFFLIQKAF